MSLETKDDLQAAEYTLGLLSAEERLAFENEMATRPELKAVMWRWQEVLCGLDRTTEPVKPSDQLWRRIDATLNKTASHRKPQRLLNWAGWAVAAALAGVIIFKPATQPVSHPIAVLNPSAGTSQFVVSYSPTNHTITVTGLNVTTGNDHSLQLWLIQGNAAPKSLGLLDKRSNILSIQASQINSQALLAVSLEPKGGSLGVLPTGPILYKGIISTGS